MQIRMKIFEGQIAVITNSIKCLHHRRPVCGAVQQRTKRFERMIAALLRVLFQMHIANAFAQHWYPVFRELVFHNVAGIKMHLHMFAKK